MLNEQGEQPQIDASVAFSDFEYLSAPMIPEQYRGSSIIGRRIQATTKNNKSEIGKIQPKRQLRQTWSEMTDVEKYILMLVSEHRHMTAAQLAVLIVNETKLHKRKGAVDNLKTYFRWVTIQKHQCRLDYKETFKTATLDGLQKKLKLMAKNGWLEEIHPAYFVESEESSERFAEIPALYTDHYYLTPLGARLLICNTAVNRNGALVKPVGFVPSYKNAAYISILHEAECNEILCSMISCASYISNPDDGKDYGLVDVCRFYHEKDVEEKGVEYVDGSKIDFKSDGKVTLYIEQFHDFVDYYMEYDSGSSTADKIKHKIEAFTKYIFWKRREHGSKFRKPVFLLVTQKPADLFPQLAGREESKYTSAIKRMTKQYFAEYGDAINEIACVLISDADAIREHGAMGACWHRVDLVKGLADPKAYDLIEASRGVVG